MSVTLITRNLLAYSPDLELYIIRSIHWETMVHTMGYLRQFAHDNSLVFWHLFWHEEWRKSSLQYVKMAVLVNIFDFVCTMLVYYNFMYVTHFPFFSIQYELWMICVDLVLMHTVCDHCAASGIKGVKCYLTFFQTFIIAASLCIIFTDPHTNFILESAWRE